MYFNSAVLQPEFNYLSSLSTWITLEGNKRAEHRTLGHILWSHIKLRQHSTSHVSSFPSPLPSCLSSVLALLSLSVCHQRQGTSQGKSKGKQAFKPFSTTTFVGKMVGVAWWARRVWELPHSTQACVESGSRQPPSVPILTVDWMFVSLTPPSFTPSRPPSFILPPLAGSLLSFPSRPSSCLTPFLQHIFSMLSIPLGILLSLFIVFPLFKKAAYLNNLITRSCLKMSKHLTVVWQRRKQERQGQQ